ncbi:MAG: hypothetical protein ACRDTP_01260 [Mycobacteriales bacterium]
MDAGLITVIVVLAGALLAAVVFMDWVALMSLLPSRSTARHEDCGHIRAIRTANDGRCWRCRHVRLDHAIEAAEHPLHR